MAIVDNYLALATGSWSWFSYGDINLKPVGQPIVITYSFETQPSPDVRLIGGFTQAYWDSFQPLTDKQRSAAKAALDAWSAASGLIFVEAKPGMGDIRFGVYDFDKGGSADSTKAAGYAFFPGSGLGGDVFIGKPSFEGLHLFLHEIGHALGMKHPFDGDPNLPTDLDTYAHTVMSYTSGGSQGDVLGDLDRAAIAYLYGAPGTALPGSWSWDAANQVLTQVNKTAGAFFHGVSSGNVITAGDGASILAGPMDNTITAGDKAAVYWSWGLVSSQGPTRSNSVVTLGGDAKVITANYAGALTITAGARADITLPSLSDPGLSAATMKITIGANGKITGSSFNGRVDITAADGATINLPYLRTTTPDAAIKSSVVAGDSAKIYTADYVHGLAIKAGAKANVTVGLGAVDVVVGADSTVFVANWTPLTPASDQISHFTFGLGGSFSATAALATNVVRSAGDTNVFGGKGSEIIFAAGKNFYIDGGAGIDITIINAAPPASFNTTPSNTGQNSWINNGLSADGKTQYWTFTNVEYAQFSNALYSFAQQKYLTDYPALATAFGALLRTAGSEISYLAVADLADRVGAAKLTSAGAMAEIVKAAGATTSVATLAYEFFTGKIPSLAGIDYLVSPSGPNTNNLNSAYYQTFNLENRYINFAVNLGKLGEGKDAFQAKYGTMGLFDATREAYKTIFGVAPSDAKIHALIDTRIDYFAAYGGDGSNGLGTKAAMVGWLLAEAVKADVGVMAKSNNAWLLDLSDGSAPFAINILDPGQGYFKSDFIFGGT